MARNQNKNKKQGGSKGQNRKETEIFLEENKKKPDVFETNSGLQYTIIKESNEPKPGEFDTVRVNQRAMLLGGKMLDDTYKEGKPMEFNLNEVIDGYKEGLMMMGIGARYKFFVPPELGWGRKGSGGRIGPNAVVIFDVSLIEIL